MLLGIYKAKSTQQLQFNYFASKDEKTNNIFIE